MEPVILNLTEEQKTTARLLIEQYGNAIRTMNQIEEDLQQLIRRKDTNMIFVSNIRIDEQKFLSELKAQNGIEKLTLTDIKNILEPQS